jgi:nitric oxide reductase activation protein
LSSQNLRRLIGRYEKELTPFSASLAVEFRRAAESACDLLEPDEVGLWAEDGLELARRSWRSWEAASEYFRASTVVLTLMEFEALRRWTQYGRDLVELSSSLAAAFFRASPGTLPHISFAQISEWVNLGRHLYKGTWRSASLAVQFFDMSPILFSQLSLEEGKALVRFVDVLAERSYDLATHCLSVAPQTISPLPREDREAFLRFAEVLAHTGWADARSYLERGPSLLVHVQASQRPRFLNLNREVARQEGRHAFTFFAEGAQALSQVEGEIHPYLLSLAEDLAPHSAIAAMEFLKTTPLVLARISVDDLPTWHAFGLALLQTSPEGGEAFFRLESSRGDEILESLSARVELSRISEVLRMYCKALTGTNVAIHPADALAEKNIGWVASERPSTEGTAIFLPASVEEHADKAENFGVYKVYSTHQACHLEFGSFAFLFHGQGHVFPSQRQALEEKRGGPKEPLTDIERYFDLFDDRRLVSDLFAIAEDARVDRLVACEYSGIRSTYRRVQEAELPRRPKPEELPLRQAFLENLVLASLDGFEHMRWPATMVAILRHALEVLETLWQPQATVEDSAEAALLLYELAQRIPNIASDLLEDWQSQEEMQMPPDMDKLMQDMSALFPSASDLPYDSPQPVEFRGEFKPELVQLLQRMRQEKEASQNQAAQQLTPEQLQQLLEKSVEITLTEMADADLSTSSALFLANLMKETTPQPPEKRLLPYKEGQALLNAGEGEEGELPVEPRYFYYDEWDFRASDYKPRWCRVVEYSLTEGAAEFFEQTLQRHSSLVAATRRQFELLRPELFRKIKGLLDGEEYDLDRVVDFLVERHAGQAPVGKVYWRRNKVERDVAVAFLLDMSASTDEEIMKHERRYGQDDFDDDPRRYFSWWMSRRAQEMLSPPKRIIDLEKESTVLLIKALETIGDAYGIYGFSGYGRENVEFYVIKDLEEPFSERIKRRIDKIAPVRSTRMGPAIRHATTKLDAHDAKVRILFLVSDGRPQDHGYGRDRTEKEYAIHDTHTALVEAKRKGIVPFCLTVDRYGHDYLKQMCDDLGYAVVADIESLPSRITTLYRRLTE